MVVDVLMPISTILPIPAPYNYAIDMVNLLFTFHFLSVSAGLKAGTIIRI